MAALRARREPPRLDRWTLHLPGEPPVDLHPADHDPSLRARWLRDESVTAVLSHSSPLGVENLPRAQSQPLLDAYHEGVASLEDVAGPDPRLGWWAALPRDSALGDSVSARRELCSLLGRGAAGLQLPAPWLSRPEDFVALQPLLATLQEADRPLFIHPGPAPAEVGSSDLGPRLVGTRGRLHRPDGCRLVVVARLRTSRAAHVACLLRRGSRTRAGAPGAAAGPRRNRAAH